MAQPVAGLRAAISRHMHSPLQAPRSWRFGRRRGRARAILTVLVALSGVLNILSALIERVNAIVADWPRIIPVPILHGTRTAVVVAGFGLLLLAQGLGHGSRLAWGLTVATLIGAALLHLVKGFDVPEAAIQGSVAALLVVYRDDFRARPDPPTQAGTLRAAVLAVIGLPLYTALGFRVLHAFFIPSPPVSAMAREALARLVLSSTGAFRPASFQARWFLDSISLIWTLALLTIGLAILRPVLRATPEQAHDRDRALALLRQWGDAPLTYMTTWPRNTLWLTGASDSYVAYRVVNGVALVLGDPIGTPGGCVRAIDEFLDLCGANGWMPCFYGTTGRLLDSYRAAGLTVLQIAEGTLIDLTTLEFKGKAWQDIRTALNRAEREGITYELLNAGQVDAALRAQLRAISNAWTAEKGLPEMGFTLGTLDELDDPQIRVALARDASGVVQGFTTWLPVYANGQVRGWTIDLMRRRLDGFKTVMEFVIARTALALRDEGYAYISLSSAPLARIEREAGEVSVLQRALDLLTELLEPFYGFESLFAFKRKFKPRWEPVYLVFPGVGALPRISVAIVRAYLPNLGRRDVLELLRSRES
ncbi:MAG TPA: DUF2156 domain-containing protein [Thermomicrobiales bacterium]|nr:DUF2156 domain-containing protein [Thermomicrobiales bacterium]